MTLFKINYHEVRFDIELCWNTTKYNECKNINSQQSMNQSICTINCWHLSPQVSINHQPEPSLSCYPPHSPSYLWWPYPPWAKMATNIPGIPGQDFPIFSFPPVTLFLVMDRSVVTMQTWRLTVSPFIYVLGMGMIGWTNINLSAPMTPSSTSSSSCVTGGSMLIIQL